MFPLMIWQHQTDRVGSLCFKSNWQKQWHAQWKLCPLSPYFKRTLHKWVKNKVKKRRKAVTCHFYILLESYFATFTNKNFKAISLHLSLNISSSPGWLQTICKKRAHIMKILLLNQIQFTLRKVYLKETQIIN